MVGEISHSSVHHKNAPGGHPPNGQRLVVSDPAEGGGSRIAHRTPNDQAQQPRGRGELEPWNQLLPPRSAAALGSASDASRSMYATNSRSHAAWPSKVPSRPAAASRDA